jgi:hypothetical protein
VWRPMTAARVTARHRRARPACGTAGRSRSSGAVWLPGCIEGRSSAASCHLVGRPSDVAGADAAEIAEADENLE